MSRVHRAPEVHSITSAPAALHDDVGPRMRKYLISMTVRTACFVLAVVCTGVLRWVFVAAALVLPYVAVVVANAGPRRGGRPTEYVEHRAVEGGRRGLG